MPSAFRIEMARSGLGLVRVSGQDAVTCQVLTLLSTEPGDLLDDPAQGLAVEDLLLYDAPTIVGVLGQRVRDQFERYLPTILLVRMSVRVDGERVEMRITYRDQQNLLERDVLVAR